MKLKFALYLDAKTSQYISLLGDIERQLSSSIREVEDRVVNEMTIGVILENPEFTEFFNLRKPKLYKLSTRGVSPVNHAISWGLTLDCYIPYNNFLPSSEVAKRSLVVHTLVEMLNETVLPKRASQLDIGLIIDKWSVYLHD